MTWVNISVTMVSERSQMKNEHSVYGSRYMNLQKMQTNPKGQKAGRWFLEKGREKGQKGRLTEGPKEACGVVGTFIILILVVI